MIHTPGKTHVLLYSIDVQIYLDYGTIHVTTTKLVQYFCWIKGFSFPANNEIRSHYEVFLAIICFTSDPFIKDKYLLFHCVKVSVVRNKVSNLPHHQ